MVVDPKRLLDPETLAPRAAASQLPQLVELLAEAAPTGPTRLAAAVDHVVEHAPRRGSVLVFTDLLDPEEQVLKRLAQLRRRKHEVTLFHVLDPFEIDFPFEDPTRFLSMDDSREVEANARDV